MDTPEYFRGKKITVMGLGLLGRGVGDAKYLAKRGADLIVTDLKTHEQLEESVKQLESFPNITFVLGEHRLKDFRDRDMILKAAGVPIDSIYIAEAKKNNIPVRMSADLFAELAGIPFVGITGTRGKSTVTHMIAAILRQANTNKILLGGNERGISTLALLADVESDTNQIAVLELDSWQLQGFGEARISPHAAVFTTIFPDHQNYYDKRPEQYLADKANIFLYQHRTDVLVLGKQCATQIIAKYAGRIESHTIITDENKLPEDWTLRIPGLHNRYNAALALEAARALGIDDAVSRKALEAFDGVPGRLELIANKKGVKIYNDTNATTPEATLAALAALSHVGFTKPNIILIMGGADKGLDMGTLIAKLSKLKRVILLAGTGTERIKSEVLNVPVFNSLKEAVTDAFAHAESGDTILFSPAFASFGTFKNEYDRGDQFNAIVSAL